MRPRTRREGVRSKGGSSRRDAVAHTARSRGGQLEAFYFAFGDHDVVVIVDPPDNEAAAATALSVTRPGAIAKTTVLLTPEQVDDAAKRSVEAVDYHPPGT